MNIAPCGTDMELSPTPALFLEVEEIWEHHFMGNYYELHLADSDTNRAIALSVDAFILPALLQVSGSSLSCIATAWTENVIAIETELAQIQR